MTASTGTDTRYDMRPGSVVDICPARGTPQRGASVGDRPRVVTRREGPAGPRTIAHGLRTFNASISGGTPDDASAYANFLHDLPGARARGVLWFLDVRVPDAEPPEPPPARDAAASRVPLVSPEGTERLHRTSVCRAHEPGNQLQRDRVQGARLPRRGGRARRHAVAVDRALARALSPHLHHVPRPRACGRASCRADGAVAERLGPHTRDRADTAAPRLRAVARGAVDTHASVATFGGTSSAFYDGVQMKVGNVRRLVGDVGTTGA
jgi:hypothetical protein